MGHDCGSHDSYFFVTENGYATKYAIVSAAPGPSGAQVAGQFSCKRKVILKYLTTPTCLVLIKVLSTYIMDFITF